MAPALVLHDDAKDVWQRPHACEATDARAGISVGKHRDGGRAWQKATRLVAIYPVGEGAIGFSMLGVMSYTGRELSNMRTGDGISVDVVSAFLAAANATRH